MKKQRVLLILISVMLIISGCIPNNEEEKAPIVVEMPSLITPAIPSGEAAYRTSLPYVPSKAKGTVASSNSRLDLNYQEFGLIEFALTQFSPTKYLFQEGQYISTDDAEDWLGRYHAEKNRLGLNPETGPNQLIHILEHDYLHMDTKELGGIVIGLAVASVTKNAEDKEERIAVDILRSRVQDLSTRIIERIRDKDVNVPILIAGYALEPSSSVFPGNYINIGSVAAGERLVSEWKNIDERYVLFPTRKITTDEESEFANQFSAFQKEIQSFFPHYAGVTGVVRFQSNEAREMSVVVRASYSSRTEVIAFTQYVSGLIPDYFSDKMKINVYIESVNKAEAIYIRPVDGDPFFHVYR